MYPLNKIFFSKSLALFVRGGFLLTVSNVFVGIFGYLFQIAVGRLLTPGEFALFSSIIALYMLLGSPLVFVNMLVVKKISVLRALDQLSGLRYFYSHIQKYLFLFSIISIATAFVAQDFLGIYIKNVARSEVLLLGLLFSINLFFAINNSFLQGLQFFGLQSVTHILFSVGKLIFGVTFIVAGLSVFGGILGVTVATACSVLLGWFFLKSALKEANVESISGDMSAKDFNFGSSSILVMSIAFALLTQFDMILVNWLYTPEQAGMYAAASVLGKAVLYIPSGLVIALFPMVVEGAVSQKSTLHLLRLALAITLLMCGILAIIYFLFGDVLIALVYGKAYMGAGDLLRWYGMAMLPLALIIVLEHYLIAHGRALFSWIFLIISPLQALAIYFWHDQLMNVVISIACCGIILLLIGMYLVGKDLILSKNIKPN
ncbi:oligosaccharide flippase family protein [Polynucleobacter sp. 73C-SIWE]|uniref:oligosaccharide flippase family protein n=1 Tax=Polynucleobacter sp. 73C-SIWE TaxID=2689098 RepID=UPI001C0DFD4F|nr:oligosaccharide flippase family protein [Polynucleobacter sp. 73C-SIWE]